jgi:hypothetical protein
MRLRREIYAHLTNLANFTNFANFTNLTTSQPHNLTTSQPHNDLLFTRFIVRLSLPSPPVIIHGSLLPSPFFPEKFPNSPRDGKDDEALIMVKRLV